MHGRFLGLYGGMDDLVFYSLSMGLFSGQGICLQGLKRPAGTIDLVKG